MKLIFVVIVILQIAYVLSQTCPTPKSRGSMSKAMSCGKKLNDQMNMVCKSK